MTRAGGAAVVAAPMDVRAALVRNTAWYGVVTALGLVSGLLMSIVLARGLGPARMGDFSYLVWAERTLTALASLGFGLATIRYTADALARGEPATAWGFVRLFMRRQVAATMLLVAVAAPVLTLVTGDLRWAFLIVVLSLFPITIESIYTHALYGAQRYDLTARTSTVKMTLHLAVAVACVMAGAGLLTLFAALGASLLVSLALQRAHVLRVYRASLAAPPAAMVPEVRGYLVPLSLVVALDAIVWDRSELFFLGLYASSEDIAFYSLAFGLATRVMIVPEIAVGALLPAFSALHGRDDRAGFTDLYRTALRSVGLVGAPVAALTAAMAPFVVVWLYGEAYLPAAGLVGVLAGVGLISALRKVAWAALRGAGDRRCALTATCVAAVVNVALAALLIPGWSVAGAVAANTAGQLTATIWVFIGIARAHGCHLPGADLARIGAAGAAALATTWALLGPLEETLRALGAGAAGMTVFVLACIGLGLLGTREWAFLVTSTRRLLASRAGGS